MAEEQQRARDVLSDTGQSLDFVAGYRKQTPSQLHLSRECAK
jgi:hypothetical protein